MKQKIFIDSDILIDLLAKRDPFYRPAAALFSLIEKEKIEGFTSPIVFSNIHYILRKRLSRRETMDCLKSLKKLVRLLAVDNRTIEAALDSPFEDFEDAIQCRCAEQNRIKYLITRNKSDYQKAEIMILTAQEFLAMLRTLDPD
jgi:predicted nucleic acid-binding protein